MKKEILLLDELTNPRYSKNLTFENINWDDFLIDMFKSKSICIVFENLQKNDLLQNIPAKLYKIMSTIYIGNIRYNKILETSASIVMNKISEQGINVIRPKILNGILMNYTSSLMPNDIDLLAYNCNKMTIHKLLQNIGYTLTRVNDKSDIKSFDESTKSLFYQKYGMNPSLYPIKIDVCFRFDVFDKKEQLMDEYFNSVTIKDKNNVKFVFNIIDFYDHINGDINNIKIDDFLKIKRLNMQYNELNSNENICQLLKKYKLMEIYNLVNKVIENHLLLY